MDTPQITPFINDNYEVYQWRHATAILKQDYPGEYQDIVQVLTAFRLKKKYITTKGGNLGPISIFFNENFGAKGWVEKNFNTQITVDKVPMDSPTHEIDCFKNRIALEIEWNNKDPFYDRDLNNFRLLFDLRAISVGVIITRSDALQDIFKQLGRGASAGNSTTHMSKLLPRVQGGSGGGCPLLVFGIKKSLYVED